MSKYETCVAIGDGSNDVSMIHTANIGVGLYGNEGSEAASNADYSMNQFSHLRHLLFVYGTPISYRVTYFILLLMVKSIAYALVPFFFAFFNAFSG